jgi:hypothetical protein
MKAFLEKSGRGFGLGILLIVLTTVAASTERAIPRASPQGPDFKVTLPDRKLPFPTPLAGRAEPGFKLRGTKGWAWTPEQFLAEIPILAASRMNFLMSCYTCVFADMDKLINRWWEPIPGRTRQGLERVVRACQDSGITFCYSMHPGLFTARPLRYDSARDFDDLWQHYAWMQGLGVRWFSLSYDDIDTKGQSSSALGTAHAGLANRLVRKLREKDPGASLIFCPVYYWGGAETGDARAYLQALGDALDPDVLVFWTGDAVVTLRLTRACAEKYKAVVRHRIVIWDNYPVNDRTGALHLGPLTGRDPDLDEAAFGYMSNPHCPQNEINRIPLLTCADYAFNPRAYDPGRSIGQAILHLADTPSQRQVLKDLVELSPGNLANGSTRPSYDSILEKMNALTKGPDAKARAADFISRVEDVAARLAWEFPGRFGETRKTLAGRIARLKAEFKDRFALPSTVRISSAAVADKIKGGWAGQTIGCTFGGPTEFRYPSTFIPEDQPLPWDEDRIASAFRRTPGLYDDVYMDLSFVEVIAKEGWDAPAASFAAAFATAKFPLWHANQMARYNLLRGIPPPESGHWLNNPHADDIDFQIEADFAGLMSPGLPNAAAAIADKIGHIMNYGDGWYGGVYIAAMYALAFVTSDLEFLVEKALSILPPSSSFSKAMRDVIRGHRENPEDWRETWLKVQTTWGRDVGCPEGVFTPFNIDAKINCAWVLMGLLYGDGDFGKTLSVSARCGDDSDCNPASAGGILGTILGYDKIPGLWKQGLAAIEEMPFPYTSLSLKDAARISTKQAIDNVLRNGGRVDEPFIEIAVQVPKSVNLEIGFEGHNPAERRSLNLDLATSASFTFEGIGFAVSGETVSPDGEHRVVRVEMAIDGRPGRVIDLPTDFLVRNPTPFWAYGLPPGRHNVVLRILDPGPKNRVRLTDLVVYTNTPLNPSL